MDKIQREAEQIAAAREARFAQDLEKIKTVALAASQEHLKHPKHRAGYREIACKVHWITHCTGGSTEIYVAMMDIQRRCIDCNRIHKQQAPIHIAPHGDDFIAMQAELVFDVDKMDEEEEEEIARLRAMLEEEEGEENGG